MINVITSEYAYNTLKPKAKLEVQNMTNFNILFNILLSMFTWENLPDTIPQEFIDAILCSTGQVAIGKLSNVTATNAEPDALYCAPCTLGGQVDAYGMGDYVIAPTPIGDIRGLRNTEVAWAKNNYTMSPDTLIYWISEQMTENDISLNYNIHYSRLLDIPVVKDEKQKQMIKDIYEQMNVGKLDSVVSDNILNEIDGEHKLEKISLTDNDKVENIQYLSRLYDDLLKRFCNIYGQALQTQNKLAQTQKDELHGMDSVSFIIPLQMLKCRQELCDNVNRIFGTDIQVRFSDAWALEYESFKQNDLNNNGIADNLEIENNDTHISASDGSKTAPSDSEVEYTPNSLQAQIDVLEELIKVYEDLTDIPRDELKGGEDNE